MSKKPRPSIETKASDKAALLDGVSAIDFDDQVEQETKQEFQQEPEDQQEDSKDQPNDPQDESKDQKDQSNDLQDQRVDQKENSEDQQNAPQPEPTFGQRYLAKKDFSCRINGVTMNFKAGQIIDNRPMIGNLLTQGCPIVCVDDEDLLVCPNCKHVFVQ